MGVLVSAHSLPSTFLALFPVVFSARGRGPKMGTSLKRAPILKSSLLNSTRSRVPLAVPLLPPQSAAVVVYISDKECGPCAKTKNFDIFLQKKKVCIVCFV